MVEIKKKFYEIPTFGGALFPTDHFLRHSGFNAACRILWFKNQTFRAYYRTKFEDESEVISDLEFEAV